MPNHGRLFRRPRFESLEDRTAPAVLVVNVAADNVNHADGVLTLRESVAAVNAGSTAGFSAGELGQITGNLGTNDEIDFAPGLAQTTVTLTGGQLAVTRAVRVVGLGNPGGITLSGTGAARLFNFDDGSAGQVAVALVNLTLSDGFTNGGDGGAVANKENLAVTNCTFLGNAAFGNGGALANAATLTLTQCTFSGNTASGSGGAVANSGTLTATGCTFVSNTANLFNLGGPNGGGLSNTGLVTLHNTLFAGDTRGSASGPADEIGGIVVTTSDHNLIGDAATAGGLVNGTRANLIGMSGSGTRDAITVVDPTLRRNGGPVPTHALVAGSPALNAGSNVDAGPVTTDARGAPYARVGGGTVDIGAYEAQTGVGAPTLFQNGAAVTSTVAAVPSAVAFGNISGSVDDVGRPIPDLVVAVSAGNAGSVLVYRGRAGGGLRDPLPDISLSLPAGANPRAVVVADFNGDGLPDLAVANSGLTSAVGASVSVFMNNRTSAGAVSFAARTDLDGGDHPVGLTTADIDGDERPDLVVADSALDALGNYDVTVLLATIGGTFGAPTAIKVGDDTPGPEELTGPTGVAVGNLSGDSKPDLAVSGGNGLVVMTNVTNLGPLSFSALPARLTSTATTSVAVGNLNDDNSADVVATDTAGGQVLLFQNAGADTFTLSLFAAGPTPTGVVLADATGDGKPDVLVVNDVGAGTFTVLGNASTATARLAAPQAFGVGGHPKALALGDTNQDGILDVATADSTSLTITFWPGTRGTEVQTFTVDSTADGDDGNYAAGKLSLHEALALANDKVGADVVTFAPALNGKTLTLTAALPGVTNDVAIVGPGANRLTIARSSAAGTPNFRVFAFFDGVSSLSGLTISGGYAAFNGGGILNDGVLSVTRCAVSGNSAASDSEAGGGISNGGLLVLADCTVSGNTSPNSGGGGVYNDGTVTATNVTFAGNLAAGAGGAVRNHHGAVTLRQCTITNNEADANGGGVSTFDLGATTTLIGAIVAGNHRVSLSMIFDDDIGGSPVDLASSFNVIGTGGAGGLTNGTNHNQVGVAIVGLGPLADNGGPTLTIALLPNSPALNAGPPGSIFLTDQRGAGRDDRPDAGAFEVQHPLSPVGVPAEFGGLYAPHPSASQNEAFVKGLYQATLLRAGSAAEVSFYVNQLNVSTLTRPQAANNFYNSPENRSNEVRFFYKYFLNRTPVQNEVNFYVQQLQAGVDEGTVMKNFILSPEFTGQNNNTQFTNTMYYAVLGRAASAGEVAFYVNQLNAHTATRDQVLANFLRSPEGIGRVVRGDYIAYLERVPTPEELTTATDQIAGEATFGSVAIGVLGGAEFYQNAGQNL